MSYPDKRVERLGQKKKMNCGLIAEVIAYRKASDIDVRFEDGLVKEHCHWGSFECGSISHPDYATVRELFKRSELKTERIGQKRVMKNGEEAKVIAYNNASDMTISFSDGTIKEHVRWDHFLNGKVRKDTPKSDRIGQKFKTAEGKTIEIIAYRDAHDCDIRFDDGTVRKHIDYWSLKRSNPTPAGKFIPRSRRTNDQLSQLVGERRMMSCGLYATIVKFKSVKNIDIEFEDGETVSGQVYKQFKAGYIAHPMLSSRTKCTYKNIEAAKVVAEKATEKIYYRCRCLICGQKDILSPQQMIEHNKMHEEEANESQN